jgi:hypothetical protein
MAATSSGPSSAPAWSNASWNANALPRPMRVLAWASMVSRAGVRTALPNRSATTNPVACHSACAAPSSGTATIVRA